MENVIMEEGSQIGVDNKIWDFTKIRKTAKIGNHNSIGMFCEIGGVIGDYCKIANYVSVYNGIEVGNNVFIGNHVSFENVSIPKTYRPIATSCYRKTIIGDGVTIEANATIAPGVNVGDYVIIGKGSVVLEDVPKGYMVHGNPAVISLKSIKRKKELQYGE